MPDASVVEQQFVTEIANILAGETYQPYAVGSCDALNGALFRLYRGWPVDQQLVKDLDANPSITNISVFSQPGQRNTTRFLRQMMVQTVEVPQPTMIATTSDNTVTFAGTGSAKELISVSIANRAGMAIRLTANDTPTTVASTLATGLNTSSSGPTLTLPINVPFSVVIGMDVRNLREVHRQCGCWRVTIWSSTPQSRDAFCSLIDPNLQGLDRFFFLDGSCSGPVIGNGFMIDDVVEKQHLWKRDLLYELEYPTDVTEIVPVLTLGEIGLNSDLLFTDTVQSDEFIAPSGTSGSGQT